jgi:hypothetical protein
VEVLKQQEEEVLVKEECRLQMRLHEQRERLRMQL